MSLKIQTLCICFTEDYSDDSLYKKLYKDKLLDMKDNNHFSKISRDSGFDMYCPQKIVCFAGKTTNIKMGIKCAVHSKIPMPYFMFPRSSISKTPLRLANSVGIIDSGYRGELVAVVDNHSNEDYIIKEGQRLFQLCTGNLMPFCNIKIVEELNETERGVRGFGSTGM